MFLTTPSKAAENCSDQFYIDQTLPNGARWDMCWEHRQREGIIFGDIHFTPKGGTRRLILNHAAVAQIHVPYDDNGTRFHDVTDYGIGGENLLDLNNDECPSGTIYPITYTDNGQSITKNGLCKQIEKNDLGFKSGQYSSKKYYLNLFSVSPVGAYYYIPTWKFMDDGSIEPWMGATGALQRFGSDESKGWKMGNDSVDENVGISHLHNFFWKLDFDLNGTHLDDVVEEVNFSLNNGKRTRQSTVFDEEAARKVNPETMRHWRISDKSTINGNGHNISYDIMLNETGHQDSGPNVEPFTFNDFYVTKQNDQEKFASHNTSGGNNLSEFVDSESITNNDIVIWTGVTFYHMPRSEDAPHMDVHWSHLKIAARDLSARNSLSPYTDINSSPSISSISNRSTESGVSTSLTIQASDVDGNSLSYSATGLPSGMSINSTTGIISGSTTQVGDFIVNVTASDGQSSSSAMFTWTITADNNTGDNGDSGGGGGTIELFFLLFFILMIVLNPKFRFVRNV